eukprot:scaffold239445_cov32-Tisochrysis_lutea.AAC.2
MVAFSLAVRACKSVRRVRIAGAYGSRASDRSEQRSLSSASASTRASLGIAHNEGGRPVSHGSVKRI